MKLTRTITGTALITVLLATSVGVVAMRGGPAAPGGDSLRLEREDSVVYVDAGSNRVHQVTREGESIGQGPICQRAAVAAGTLACLFDTPAPASSQMRIYRHGTASPDTSLVLWGEPSRTRVSPSGRLVAWTVFRSGDSYVQHGAFSTTTGIYDLRTKAHYGSLEDFTAYVGGKPFKRDDINYWGITFTDDDRHFYATMSAAGKTRLMRGDLRTRRLTALRGNVECPSLSPDGTRIAYKKRSGDRWRLHVLNLRWGTDTVLAERDSIDDQAAWLDDTTVAYAKPEGRRPAVYTVPADGSGTPTKLLDGRSPTAITKDAGAKPPTESGRP
ncbi:hypothetical protein AB0D49_29685 [Streptomyces sp. NPDC048290]|uniref:hypothetical protein n=1 Tax=Streptomyces sp. NPDC048290 TaxID=3155811 RepID=UPI00341A5F57